MSKSNNNFLPYSRQEVIEEDIKNVIDVLKSDFLTQGDKVPLLEKFTLTINKLLKEMFLVKDLVF